MRLGSDRWRKRRTQIDLTTASVVANRWFDDVHSIEFIAGWENFVFKVSSNSCDFVLRLSEISHRSLRAIISEAEIVQKLSDTGVLVNRPILSFKKLLVEEIFVGGSYYSAVVFDYLPGTTIADLPTGSIQAKSLWGGWARLVACLHESSSSDWMIAAAEPRPHLFDPNSIRNSLHESSVGSRRSILFQSILNSEDSYSYNSETIVIHADLHGGNTKSVLGTPSGLFDFDDCALGSREYELAVLFYWSLFRFEYDEIRPSWNAFTTEYQRISVRQLNWDRILNCMLLRSALDMAELDGSTLKLEVSTAYVEMRRSEINDVIQKIGGLAAQYYPGSLCESEI